MVNHRGKIMGSIACHHRERVLRFVNADWWWLVKYQTDGAREHVVDERLINRQKWLSKVVVSWFVHTGNAACFWQLMTISILTHQIRSASGHPDCERARAHDWHHMAYLRVKQLMTLKQLNQWSTWVRPTMLNHARASVATHEVLKTASPWVEA